MVGPRRRNHEGHARLRADGRWEVMTALEGVRHSDYGRTADEALAKARKRVRDHEAGLRPVDGRVTVEAWLNEWIRDYVTPTKAPRTTESYRDICERYLIPSLGRIRLAQLSAQPERIQRMVTQLSANPRLSPSTVRYVFVVLRIALRRAVKAGRLQVDPTTFVDAPPEGVFDVEPLTAAEAARLLEAIRDRRSRAPRSQLARELRNEALIRTILSAGLRRGELLGLTWPAIDLDQGRLQVRAQLIHGELAAPKRSSVRSVDLPPETVAALRAHKAGQVRPLKGTEGWDEREFVFAGEFGHPLNPRGVARAFETVLRHAGLPHQRLHDLRHAFATILLEEGEDLVIVSKLLGHKSLSTTADIYSHLTPELRAGAAQRMGAALRRKVR